MATVNGAEVVFAAFALDPSWQIGLKSLFYGVFFEGCFNIHG